MAKKIVRRTVTKRSTKQAVNAAGKKVTIRKVHKLTRRDPDGLKD